jgi:hypothetical protein
MWVKRTALIALAVVVAVGLCAGLAGAEKRDKKGRGWGTKVTLTHPADAQFAGKVSSKLAACVDQRLVNLYYTDPATGQTQPLAVDRTNKRGQYQMNLPRPAFGGTYQAQAPKVSKRGSLLCRAGRSNIVAVPVVPLTP